MSGGPKLCYVDAADGERNHQIMQSFAKTIWNVLKEYNKKLKVIKSHTFNSCSLLVDCFPIIESLILMPIC